MGDPQIIKNWNFLHAKPVVLKSSNFKRRPFLTPLWRPTASILRSWGDEITLNQWIKQNSSIQSIHIYSPKAEVKCSQMRNRWYLITIHNMLPSKIVYIYMYIYIYKLYIYIIYIYIQYILGKLQLNSPETCGHEMIPLGSLPGEPPKPQLFCRTAASAVPRPSETIFQPKRHGFQRFHHEKVWFHPEKWGSWSWLIRFELAMDESWVPWCLSCGAPTTQISTGRLGPGQRDMVKSPKIINEFSILACETCIKI